jgi:hypothetical protein
VVRQGIFANALADEWTEPEPESKVHSTIIDHVIKACDFSADSVMVKYIEQQQWSTLASGVSIGLEEFEEFFTVKTDGITFKATPMLGYLRRFLLFYHGKTCWGEGPTDDAGVMHWTPKVLMEYCSSMAYRDDYDAACPAAPLKSLKRDGSYDSIRETINGSGTSSVIDPVRIHEFHQSISKTEDLSRFCQKCSMPIHGIKVV